MRAPAAAIANAHLVNVPNPEEALFLRDPNAIDRPVLGQPYGLRSEYRQALASAAASAADRLKNKMVAFVGMWAPRKGARVWGEIARRVCQNMPDARFSFIGTMVDRSAVLQDIDPDFAPQLEVVSEFSPDQLPSLLSKSTVGAFPSYVEGFGLAVIE